MTTHSKTLAGTGVALAAAGAVALTPMHPVLPDLNITRAEVALSAAQTPGGLIGGFIAAFEYGLNTSGADRVNAPIPDIDPMFAPFYVAANIAASGARGIEALVGAPAVVAQTLTAVATGDWGTVGDNLVDIIDAPLWAADPTLFALRDVLPGPFGGTDGLVWGIREAIRDSGRALESALLAMLPAQQSALLAAAQAPGPTHIGSLADFIAAVQWAVQAGGGYRVNNPQPVTDPIQAAAFLAVGLAASGIRTVEGLAMAPLGIAQLAVYAATGDEANASATLKNLLDGPLWAADPALFAVRDTIPAPIGGTGGIVMTGREVVRQTGNGLESAITGALGWPDPNPAAAKAKVAASTSAPTSKPAGLNLTGTRTFTVDVPKPAAGRSEAASSPAGGPLSKVVRQHPHKQKETGTASNGKTGDHLGVDPPRRGE